jgi:release factor glutamine methyltransferase
MTVLEVIQHSARFLEGKGVESPRLQGELILAHVLKLPRLQLYLKFDQVLTGAEIAAARELVQRRGRREPLQHILGTANFCGLDLWVTPDVLIPRPETELLAERAVAFLKARSCEQAGNNLVGADVRRLKSIEPAELDQSLLTSAPTILDLGTGSGCLPIYLAHEHPSVQVTTVDISPAALTVARENARRHGVLERVEFLEGDGFTALPPGRQFDLIVSNPPYIPSAEIETLEPEVRDHDPRLALDGGADGLEFYRRIAAEAPHWLKPGGKLMLELGHDQAAAVREICEGQMWIVEAIEPDYSRIPRILIARRG